MHLGERSSTYVFAAITLFLAALAGLIIPLASGGASRNADVAWTPPALTATRPMATATPAATRTPLATFTVQAPPTRQAPTATTAAMTAATPTAESTATPDVVVPPAPTETVTPAPMSDANNAPIARIAGDAVNLRAGPGTSFGILATASTGDTFAITGQSADGAPADGSAITKWWRVCCVAGGPAWVANDFIEIIGDTGAVPIAP